MKNIQSKNREKILAIITLYVVIGAFIYAMIISPQINERQARLDRLTELQLKLAKMKSALQLKDRTDDIYSLYEPLIASSGNESKEKAIFSGELQDLYQGLKVDVKSVAFNPVVKEEFFQLLYMRIEMSGHIREIMKFILAVDTYEDKPIRIEKLSITALEIADNIKASFVITKVIAGINE